MHRLLMNWLLLLSLFESYVAFAWATESPDPVHDLWTQFKTSNQKSYAGLEDKIRKRAFDLNVQFIAKHNLEADMGLHSFWLSVNTFADMTNDEYRSHTGSLVTGSNFKANNTYYGFTWEIPDHVDWRSKKIVTPVKDQGSCRASWAFAAVTALEGQHALFTETLQELSEQQLIDCSSDFGNEGCGPGSVNQAFKYIELAGGIDASDTYPSRHIHLICQFDRQHVIAKVSGFVSVMSEESVLKDAVANVGPVSVSLDTTSVYFQFYSRGVLSDIPCSNDANHALTVVGYSSDGEQEYWLLKNSWGTKWGEDGYLRLARNRQNLCGIASDAGYPLLQTF